MSPDSQPAAAEIDAIVAAAGGWRGDALARLRRVVLSADEGIVEEIKWRKPSKPEGVATWVCDGNVAMADDVAQREGRHERRDVGELDEPRGLGCVDRVPVEQRREVDRGVAAPGRHDRPDGGVREEGGELARAVGCGALT